MSILDVSGLRKVYATRFGERSKRSKGIGDRRFP